MDFFDALNKRRSVRRYTPTPVPDTVIQKALDAALKAPNSSNLQPWEFYWVKSPEKKQALVDACLFQGTAKTASHLVVAVARIDTWKRNRNLLFKQMEETQTLSEDNRKDLKAYYFKVIPFLYIQDPFGILGTLKWIILNMIGLFRPVARGPAFKKDLIEVVSKTTALACENFMLAIVAQGYGCCPMEGFDESRVKKILGLSSNTHIVMTISVGEAAPGGVFGPQLRLDPKLVIHEV